MTKCSTCGAEGFAPSKLPGRCEFCDGSFGGNPPTQEEIMRELFIQAHEALVEEYMQKHPEATWREAYDVTADQAHDRMKEMLGDRMDRLRDMEKEK